MTVSTGKRNKFITIVRPIAGNDFVESAGETERVCECWAHIRPANGLEIEDARSMQQRVTHAVEIDFQFVEIKPGDFLKVQDRYGQRHMEIKSIVNPDEADRELKLVCIEVANNG